LVARKKIVTLYSSPHWIIYTRRIFIIYGRARLAWRTMIVIEGDKSQHHER